MMLTAEPSLPELRWLHLESVHALRGDLSLGGPGTLGNVLRSVLGLALHQQAPATAERFMGRADEADALRPWWMWPQEPDEGCFAAGAPLHVRWSLSATALHHLSPLVQALETIGRLGLGSQRVKADLVSLQVLSPYGTMSLSGAREPDATWSAQMLWQQACTEAALQWSAAQAMPPGRFRPLWIRAHTPLRLKRRGELLLAAPALDQVINACMGRLDALARASADKLPRPDALWLERQVWLQWAQGFEPLHTETVDVSLSRWSSRQRRSMVLSGLRGLWSYETLAVLALPWLRLAEHLQLGGKTSFGMGTLQVELPLIDPTPTQQGDNTHDLTACPAV
jgi:hypothetical protein